MLLGPRLLDTLQRQFECVWMDSNGQINVTCPFCSIRGMTPDLSGHLGLNFEKDAAHCVRCDWGKYGLRAWLGKQFGISGLAATMREAKSSLDSLRKRMVPRKVGYQFGPAKFPADSFFFEDWHFDANLPHIRSLLDKGITKDEIFRHQLGFQAEGRYSEYVLFPFFEDDEIVYWQGRSHRDDAEMKKMNPPPSEAPLGKSHWLYGLEQAKMGCHIVLVEGTLDTISTTTWIRELEGEGNAALGLNGTAMSFPDGETHPLNTHFGRLCSLEPSKVSVLLDRDAIKKGEELALILASAGLPAKAVPLTSAKDPNDAGSEKLTAAYRGDAIDRLRQRAASDEAVTPKTKAKAPSSTLTQLRQRANSL